MASRLKVTIILRTKVFFFHLPYILIWLVIVLLRFDFAFKDAGLQKIEFKKNIFWIFLTGAYATLSTGVYRNFTKLFTKIAYLKQIWRCIDIQNHSDMPVENMSSSNTVATSNIFINKPSSSSSLSPSSSQPSSSSSLSLPSLSSPASSSSSLSSSSSSSTHYLRQ